MKKQIYFLTLALALLVCSCNKPEQRDEQHLNFEKLVLSGTQSFWNGSDSSGFFVADDFKFINHFNSQYQSWSGFAYSNISNMTNSGYDNQYASMAGHGSNDAIYVTSYTNDYDTACIWVPAGVELKSFEVCNSTLAALSMKNGDNNTKQFGGISGNDPDWFKLIIIGYDEQEKVIGSVEFMLADFRFADNTKDYIVDTWKTVNIESIATARKLRFSMSSTDNGQYGMNTPSYFCIDHLIYTTKR